jgi:chemotaxis protein methyltransferase CheR
MPASLSEGRLSQLADFVRTHLGLHFPPGRRGNLETGIRRAAGEFGFQDVESCLDWLLSTTLEKSQVEVLASHLTVGETYFFRDLNSYRVLEESVLPPLIQARSMGERRLRIWSAACATGEEPYTLAMVVKKLIPDQSDWNITILGTDINPRVLEKAARGTYSKWSFRDVPGGTVERFFRSAGNDRWEVLPEIRRMVTFSYLNLILDSYPALLNGTNAMDVIFCRNVIMYFSEDGQRHVIGNLHQCLLDGGWLAVSGCEGSQVLFSKFVPVNFPDAIFYRRDSRRVERTEDLAVAGAQLHPPVFPTVKPVLVDSPPNPPAAPIPPTSKKRRAAGPPADLYLQAVALFERGRYQSAAESILDRVTGGPIDVRALVLLTRIYANQGRLVEALGWSEKAIAADKVDPGTRFFHAAILQELGRVEEAKGSLRQAIYLDGEFVMAHYAMANLAFQEGDEREAARSFRVALQLLDRYDADARPRDSEGLTAGRLTEIIRTITKRRTGDAG